MMVLAVYSTVRATAVLVTYVLQRNITVYSRKTRNNFVKGAKQFLFSL